MQDILPMGVLFVVKSLLFIVVLGGATWWLLSRWLGKAKTKLVFASMILLAISTSIALIAAEFVTRIALADITSTGDNTSYFSSRWRSDNPPIKNQLGFREKEIALQPLATNPVTRIAVIGDSYTYGQGLKEEERFTHLIGTQLNKSSSTQSVPNYEVLNFGRAGAETVDHVNFLNDTVLGIQPDFVLLQWYINDVEGHDKSGRPTSLRLIPSDFLSSIMHRNSALYYVVNQQWQILQSVIGLGSKKTYLDYMQDRFQESKSKGWQEAQDALLKFIDSCKQRDIPVGIVMFPFTRKDDISFNLGFLLDRVVEICRVKDLPCVDMRTSFLQQTPELLKLNKFDRHPSALANQIAAKEILSKFAPIWTSLNERKSATAQSGQKRQSTTTKSK